MIEGIAIKLAKENNQPEEWGWKQFTDQITLKRLSKPEDVANVVSFLARIDSVMDYLSDRKKAVNEEYYELCIDGQQIRISAATPHGVFNGTQTLLGLLKGQESPFRLEAMSIQDYPDLLYRGQMLDIARNYTTVDNLKKLIDMLSSYKLNVLQFHFSDDEGWRLEIPGLEELTAIGSRRTYNR